MTDLFNQVKEEVLKERLIFKNNLGEFKTRTSQYNSILRQIADSVAVYSTSRNEDESDFLVRINDAFDIVEYVKAATSSDKDNEDAANGSTVETHIIWRHQSIKNAIEEGFESEYARRVDKVLLNEMAIQYLQRPWMENELLEWILVDALIFDEVLRFGEDVKAQSYPKDILNQNLFYYQAKGKISDMESRALKYYLSKYGNRILYLWLGPTALTVWAYYQWNNWRVFLGLGAYFVIYSVIYRTISAAREPKIELDKARIQANIELYEGMGLVYEVLASQCVCPWFLRQRLVDTSNMGAIWPSGALMIVQHAVDRNPAMWNVSEHFKYK